MPSGSRRPNYAVGKGNLDLASADEGQRLAVGAIHLQLTLGHFEALGLSQELQISALLIHHRLVGAGHQGRDHLLEPDLIAVHLIVPAIRITASVAAGLPVFEAQADFAAGDGRIPANRVQLPGRAVQRVPAGAATSDQHHQDPGDHCQCVDEFHSIPFVRHKDEGKRIFVPADEKDLTGFGGKLPVEVDGVDMKAG